MFRSVAWTTAVAFALHMSWGCCRAPAGDCAACEGPAEVHGATECCSHHVHHEHEAEQATAVAAAVAAPDVVAEAATQNGIAGESPQPAGSHPCPKPCHAFCQCTAAVTGAIEQIVQWAAALPCGDASIVGTSATMRITSALDPPRFGSSIRRHLLLQTLLI